MAYSSPPAAREVGKGLGPRRRELLRRAAHARVPVGARTQICVRGIASISGRVATIGPGIVTAMAIETPNRLASLGLAALVNVTALLVFGAMIIVQIAGGVDNYPVVPPGLVISLAVVALVVLRWRWRWTMLVALAWPIMLTVGAFLAQGSLDALSGGQGMFVQVTSIVQRAALLVAVGGGGVAVVQRYSTRSQR